MLKILPKYPLFRYALIKKGKTLSSNRWKIIQTYPTPIVKRRLRGFLSFTGYCRHLVPKNWRSFSTFDYRGDWAIPSWWRSRSLSHPWIGQPLTSEKITKGWQGRGLRVQKSNRLWPDHKCNPTLTQDVCCNQPRTIRTWSVTANFPNFCPWF